MAFSLKNCCFSDYVTSKMSWSKKRHHRQSWAEEVIAAAMKIDLGREEVKTDEDDEGIVSDESPASSSNDEITPNLNHNRPQADSEGLIERHVKEKPTNRKDKVTFHSLF